MLVYWDLAVLWNFALDYLLLRVCTLLAGVEVRRRRLILGALFGAGFAVAALFVPRVSLLLVPALALLAAYAEPVVRAVLGEQWLVWCDLNVEGDAITNAIPDAVQVKGADAADFKEKTLNDFATGALRVLVSKPSIAGFGMNFQSCHNIVFVGLSDSYEAFYQAIRRCWRFGQAHEVECYVICADSDGAVVENIRRKEAQSSEMFDEVVKAMGGLSAAAAHRNEMIYNPTEPVEIPVWLRPVA